MAKLQEQKTTFEQKPMIPKGEHILTLTDTKPYDKKVAPQFQRNENDKTRPALLWIYESDKTDEEGTNYEYCFSTGVAYGHPEAKLTKHVDMSSPGITYAEAVNLDTEEWHGRKWKAMIVHKEDKQEKGKFWPEHLYLIPIAPKKAGKNTPSAPLTEEDSPYADE